MSNSSKANEPAALFTTMHGSRLYGLSNETSDRDRFTVLASPTARTIHSVTAWEDTVSMGWKRFLLNALSGSHQSVEALFSNRKSWSPQGLEFKPMFDAIRIEGGEVYEKYERTIRKFAYGDFKRRRHAVRLSYNLDELRREGRFNPEMTETERKLANQFATNMFGAELLDMLGVPVTNNSEWRV